MGKLLIVKQPIHPVFPVKKHFGNGKCSGEVKDIRRLFSLRKTVFACSKKFHGDKFSTERCVQSATHLSGKCSSCFGDYAACVTKTCWFTCAFKSDEACKNAPTTSALSRSTNALSETGPTLGKAALGFR